MTRQMNKIQDKIRALEEQKAKLMPMRRDEIFSVLEHAGGLTLDNQLLAGLAIYASNPENKTSNFMRELYELGKAKIPSKKRISKKANTSSIESNVSKNPNEEKKANG